MLLALHVLGLGLFRSISQLILIEKDIRYHAGNVDTPINRPHVNNLFQKGNLNIDITILPNNSITHFDSLGIPFIKNVPNCIIIVL